MVKEATGGRAHEYATGGLSRPLLISRVASLGTLVLTVALVGRLLLAPPTSLADLALPLLLLFGVTHLALLGIASWRFDEGSDELRGRSGRVDRRDAMPGTGPRKMARGGGTGTASGSYGAHDRARAVHGETHGPETAKRAQPPSTIAA